MNIVSIVINVSKGRIVLYKHRISPTDFAVKATGEMWLTRIATRYEIASP